MISHQLKFAYRSLSRSKAFTAINICGLIISLTAVILMLLYIENELSFDRFHQNAERIYRVVDDKKTNALLQHGAGSPGPLAPALLADFPQVKKAVRLINGESLVKYRDKLFEERHLYFSDPEIFSLFNFKLINGDPSSALKEPMTLIMTRTTARKYFGNSEGVGRTVLMDGKNFKVTGITNDVPANSHIQFDILVSMATAERKDSGYDWLFTNWYSNNFHTYILLAGKNDAVKLAARLDDFAGIHKANSGGTIHHYRLEKLTEIYLHSDRDNQIGKTGNTKSLYIFSVIAIFMLLLATINFVNLSTARALIRAKEVAVKKVNGVSRLGLILQFFMESYLMVGVAIIIAIVAASMLLPAFNQFSGKEIVFDILSPVHAVALVLITFIVGFLSGCYPAIVLSGFDPVTALKGAIRVSTFDIGIRKGLVVFQFSVSVILIISSITVFRQLTFMRNHNLGFQAPQTMVINFEGDKSVQKNYELIRNEMMRIKGVKDVTASSAVPGDLISGWSMDFAKKTGDTIHAELPIYLTDFNFMKQYHIPMVAGRALSPEFAGDTVESMIINQAALLKLGFNNADEAIGVKVGMYPNDARIIGVYQDFHFESLQKAIQPLAMRIMPDKFRVFSVDINSNDLPATIRDIEMLWKVLVPQRPMEFSFLNDSFNQQYKSEIKFGQLFGIFTALAICIACFGLFGLAYFSVKQRKKEIGIRKVIGASVLRITTLITTEFLLLVIISMFIACPVAYLAMNQWIEGFAYRTDVSWWIFAVGSLIAIVVALGTIGYQAIKAALTNPVQSLRNDQ